MKKHPTLQEIAEEDDRLADSRFANRYSKQLAICHAQALYRTMTDYRWYSRAGLSWESYSARKQLELVRLRAKMYEIQVLGIY